MIRPRAAIVAAALAGASLPGARALAAGVPQITVQASATQIEVGEVLTVELTAMVEQGSGNPQSPELRAPRELNVVGQSEGTQMAMSQSGSRMTVQVGLRAVWQLTGQKAGRFTIPAPTVEYGGRRYAGTAVMVEVVPSTGRARRQPRNSPFLMPGGPSLSFPFSFPSFPQDDDASSGPRTVPELGLPAALDPQYFVHAVADRKSAVVGQQVAVSVYIYIRDARSNPVANHDAPLSDFLRIPLTGNPGTDQPAYAMVGDKRFITKRMDYLAIFPLKAGDLHTGSWRWDFNAGRGRPAAARASEDLVIHVTEPPRAGRPPGYTLGDVGQFTLTASVDPRRIDQGSEVAVRLRLSGTGNLPQSLRVPERTGIEWLDPEKKESIEPQGGVVGGWRTFGYVVRIKESGSVDLGEVTLPYWDPAASQYRVARAVLGKVEVNPTAPALDPTTHKPIEQPAPDPFASMPGARAELGSYVAPRPRRLDGPGMWGLIAAPPLLVGFVSLGAGAARRARARRVTSKESPAMLAQAALADARRAEREGDGKALAAALERAVHLAVEGATGLRSRGVLLGDLPGELEDRGVSPELGDEIAGALAACEALRFDPVTSGEATHDLAARVRSLVADLGRWKAP